MEAQDNWTTGSLEGRKIGGGASDVRSGMPGVPEERMHGRTAPDGGVTGCEAPRMIGGGGEGWADRDAGGPRGTDAR